MALPGRLAISILVHQKQTNLLLRMQPVRGKILSDCRLAWPCGARMAERLQLGPDPGEEDFEVTRIPVILI